ncbi:MAG: hypothetical protein IT437_11780 [Phycisphaerales bacterium]|nr:hypothetical protein [Phycisphaerales bacterium]
MNEVLDLLRTLWMPMVLSAVIVFVASAVIWMASPLHKGDFKGAGGQEDALLGIARSLSPGVYMAPWCHDKAGKEAAMAKAKEGHMAMLTVTGSCNFGRTLALWFVHLLVVGLFVAYISSLALAAKPVVDYLQVFQVAGTAAFLAYGGYAVPMALWHGMPMRQVPGKLLDALIYACLTAGTFGWLWPHAPVV